MTDNLIKLDQVNQELQVLRFALHAMHLRLKAELARTISAGFRDYFRSKGFKIYNSPDRTEAKLGAYTVTLTLADAAESSYILLEASEHLPARYQITLRRKTFAATDSNTPTIVNHPLRNLTEDLAQANKRKAALLSEIKNPEKIRLFEFHLTPVKTAPVPGITASKIALAGEPVAPEEAYLTFIALLQATFKGHL